MMDTRSHFTRPETLPPREEKVLTVQEKHQRRVDDYVRGLPPLQVTLQELEALGEYSATLPTGTTPGKRWRSKHGWQFAMRYPTFKARWIVGEFDPTDDSKSPQIKINWYRPVIRVPSKSFKTTNREEHHWCMMNQAYWVSGCHPLHDSTHIAKSVAKEKGWDYDVACSVFGELS